MPDNTDYFDRYQSPSQSKTRELTNLKHMKKNIIIVLVFLSLFFSCQNKERGFSKSDLVGTWYDAMTSRYTLNENGTGNSFEPLGEFDLNWSVRNDSLFIDFTQGTNFKQWKCSIDSIVNGETKRREKIRILYLSSSSDYDIKLNQFIEH